MASRWSLLSLGLGLALGCTSFLGDGETDSNDSVDGADTADTADTAEVGDSGCDTPAPCGDAGSLGYAGGWARVDGQGVLRLYFSTPATPCGSQNAAACDPNCGSYESFTLSVQTDPGVVGSYDLAGLEGTLGSSEYGCDEGEAWSEGGENPAGGGVLDVVEATDSCISGSLSGVSADGSFSVPRC